MTLTGGGRSDHDTRVRVAAEIRVWKLLLGADKAGYETRIARLEGIDNTYESA